MVLERWSGLVVVGVAGVAVASGCIRGSNRGPRPAEAPPSSAALEGVRRQGRPFVVGAGDPRRTPVTRTRLHEVRARVRPLDARTSPRTERVCRQDTFFIEVPLRARPWWPDDQFTAFVAHDLWRVAKASCGTAASWFDGAACPTHVDVRPVLEPRSAPAARIDGHLRFFRFSFYQQDAQLSVKDAAACQVVETLRLQFLARASEGSAEGLQQVASKDASELVRVGRECDGAGLETPAASTGADHDWYLDAMEARQAPSAAGVDIAVVDSGVPGVPDAAGLMPGSDLHPHGATVARLIEQVAAGASILSYRVLDKDGLGSTAMFARGLDAAVLDAVTRRRPRIVNLSLGWTPKKSAAVRLTGTIGQCSTVEDGVGASVRYVLSVARALDASGVPIAVFAAAGNRLHESTDASSAETLEILPYELPMLQVDRPYSAVVAVRGGSEPYQWSTNLKLKDGINIPPPQHDRFVIDGQRYELADQQLISIKVQTASVDKPVERFYRLRTSPAGSCRAPFDAVNRWFFPSAWEQDSVCTGAAREDRPLAWAVGAIDDRGQRPLFSRLRPAPRFAGPGVMISSGEASSFVFGTSFSTALVSAVAAQAQAQRLAANRPPLDTDALARVLHVTGRSVAVNLDDATDAFAEANNKKPYRVVVPSLQGLSLADCETPLADGEYTWNHRRSSLCGRPRTAVSFPVSAKGLHVAPDLSPTVAAFSVNASKAAASEFVRNFGTRPDVYALASNGPSPTGPTCGICIARWNGITLGLFVGLSPELEGAQFAQPRLLIASASQPASSLLALDLPNSGQWVPGTSQLIEVEWPTDGTLPPVGDLQLGLEVTVNQDGAKSTHEVSPFELEL